MPIRRDRNAIPEKHLAHRRKDLVMRVFYREAIFAIGIFLLAGESSQAAVFGLQLVASGLVSPVGVAQAPGDRDRLFIVENGFPFDGEDATADIRILNLKTGVVE